MLILVINSGSSSNKFRLVDVVKPTSALTSRSAMFQGAVKGIGGANFEVTGQPPFDEDFGNSGPCACVACCV